MAKTLDFQEGHEFSSPAKEVSFERVLMFCGGPLSNMPNWPEINIHTDRDHARSVGLPDVNASGTQFEGMLAAWMKVMDESIATARQNVDDQGLAVLDKLRKSGVYHNIEASRAILRNLTDGYETTDKTAIEH